MIIISCCLIPIATGKLEIAEAVVEGLTEQTTPIVEETTVEETRYKKISAAVILSEFKLQLFQNEPVLVDLMLPSIYILISSLSDQGHS